MHILYANTYVWYACLKMEASTSSAVIPEAVLEDKIADFRPDYPCLLCDVRSADFKNRELREIAVVNIAVKRRTSDMFYINIETMPMPCQSHHMLELYIEVPNIGICIQNMHISLYLLASYCKLLAFFTRTL